MRYWFILALMVAAGACGYYIVSGSYPVAIVNWNPISLKAFNDNKYSAEYYYRKLYEQYETGKEELEKEASKKEITRAVLDRLVEDRLIWDELKTRIGESERTTQVQKKIQEAIEQKNIADGVSMLYGVSLGEFIDQTLKPLAAREILEDRLRLENIDFEKWLASAKEHAQVTLFLPNISWDSIKGIINK